MNFLRHFFIWSAATAVLVACGPKLQPQDSCNFVQNSQVQRVSWKGHLPISIWIHESVPAQFHPAVMRAMARWEYAIGRPVFKLGGIQKGEIATQRDNQNTIYWMNTWSAGKTAEQARTTIFWTDATIDEADIFVNASLIGEQQVFDFSATDPSSSQVDFESLTLHELGHVLGLAHNTGERSVMNPNLASGLERRNVQGTDLNSLKCEY